MKLKLVIDGSDMRVRIEPENGGDRKLLEFVDEFQEAYLVTKKKSTSYSTEIEFIDMRLRDRGAEK